MTLPAITRLQLTNFEVLKTTTACLVYMSLVLFSFNWFLALQIKISQIRVQPCLNYNLSFCMQSWYYGVMMLINPLILFVISTNSWFILLKAENIIFCKKLYRKNSNKNSAWKTAAIINQCIFTYFIIFYFCVSFLRSNAFPKGIVGIICYKRVRMSIKSRDGDCSPTNRHFERLGKTWKVNETEHEHYTRKMQ